MNSWPATNRLEHTVINDGRCGGRLFIDNGAFLGSRISHHIVLGRNIGLRKGRSDRKRDESARKQKFLHGLSSSIRMTLKSGSQIPDHCLWLVHGCEPHLATRTNLPQPLVPEIVPLGCLI